jgi:hypothetical protein
MTHLHVNTSPDRVLGSYKGSTIYLWRGIAYQVVLYKNIKKVGSKHDHFIKQGNYGIREVSNELLRRLLLDNNTIRDII